MSLINDMLNDLEARRANELQRSGLQREVRPLPRQGKTHGPLWWVLALLVLVSLGGIGFYFWPQAAPKPALVASAPLPPATPAAPPAEAVQPPVVDAVLIDDIPDLRAATTLAAPPLEASTSSTSLVQTTTTAIITTTTLKVTTTTQPARPVAAAVPAPQPTAVRLPADAAAIDKRAVFASPRERLEAETRNAVQQAAAGKVSEASAQLREILREEPALTLARQALLRLLLEQRKGDEMMAVLADGLDLQPAQTGWAISLARLWVERGDYANAQRVLARSAGHARNQPEYLGFFAHVHYKQGDHRQAAELYQAAARQAPGEGRWWLGLGVALEAEGRGGDAREAYRQALASGSLNADLAALAEQKLR